MKKRRVLFVSLGCPKNQVDGELMLAKLQNAGFENADNFERLDAVIVNTCAFIDSAKQEAIDTILEMVGLKKDGLVRAVIVTGCLAERYRDEILQEIPEVDAVVGIGANGDIDKIVDEVLDGKQTNVFPDKKELPMCGERVLTTPDYWAYLKIAEGCSNCCTYCAIPSIRGPFRSRDEESIVEEAKTLANGGVKELVLIAQDVSSYGIDIYGEYRLAHLLDLLCEIDGIEWIRLLYCYPDKITDSQYVANAFLKGWIWNWKKNGWKKSDKKPVLNPELWERLLKALSKHEYEFIWVKGHAGHPENERCDRLAVAQSEKYAKK